MGSSKNEWLENLEMEIYLSDLNESEIKEKLETEYIGIDIFKWMSKRKEKLNEAATKFLNSLKEETPKIEDLRKIDGTFKHEITGRRDEICKRVNNSLKEYSSLLEKTTSQVKEIYNQGIPDKEELDEIEKAFDEWKSQINKIDKEYKEFCTRCRQTCSNRSSCLKETR